MKERGHAGEEEDLTFKRERQRVEPEYFHILHAKLEGFISTKPELVIIGTEKRLTKMVFSPF